MLLAATLSSVAVLAVVSYWHAPLIAWMRWTSERDILVAGPLHADLLSLHPRISGQRVTIRNPDWTQPGTLAKVDRLNVAFTWPLPWRRLEIRDLRIEGARLDLVRDASGHANWQWRDTAKEGSAGPPLIHHLLVSDTHARLDDAMRHLQFEGSLRTVDTEPALRIQGSGRLNGDAVHFRLDGDPLETVSRAHPYAFRFDEQSSGSHLVARGALARPFDLRRLQVAFEVGGEDLKDVYCLVGLTLLNTGPYRVSGELAREGSVFSYTTLSATSGESDMRGSVTVDSAGQRPQIRIDLTSRRLRLADLGPKAAGRAPAPGPDQPLFPNSPLPLKAIRHSDFVVHFQADRLDVGRTSWRSVAARMKIDHGTLHVEPFTAALADGTVKAELTVNTGGRQPRAELKASATNVQLAHVLGSDSRSGSDTSTAPAELDGPLFGQLHFTATGATPHEMAASLDGHIAAVVPHGTLRSSSAELAGLDLGRGLGLLAMGDRTPTELRCAVASFQADDGVLTAHRLVVDTQPVLITGEGTIQLDPEKLDLTLRSRPKHLRLLRARAPILVRGSLRHPSLRPATSSTLIEAGAAVALGVLLTPVAAVLASVDPGLAKNADCQALLAQAEMPAQGKESPGEGKEAPARAQ